MKTFPTLLEFLLLEDEYGNSVHQNINLPGHERLSKAQDLVNRYKLGAESWGKYGDGGPPIGKTVITLRAGFGGTGGEILKVVEGTDSRFISLQDVTDKRMYLADKATWWVDLKVKGS